MPSGASRIGTLATPALIAGVVLFGLLLVRQGVGAVLDAVAVAGVAGLLAVTLFHLVLPIGTAAIGWHRLLPPAVAPPLGIVLLARWIGEAVNDMLPVAGVGGNVAKAQVLRRYGVPGVVAGASVVVDVTLVVTTQLLFTVAGLVGFVFWVGETRTTLNALAGLAVMSVLLAGFYALQRRGLFAGLAGLLERVVEGPQFAALAGGARALDVEVKALYGERERVARSAAWHLVQWCSGAGEVWLALWFLGHPVGLLEAFLLESLSQAVRTAAFVVPAGIGVQEAGFLALGAVLGIPPETALALSLVKRVPEIALGLPGLVAWWSVGRGGATLAADKEHRPHPVVRVVNRITGPGRRFVRFDADALLAEAQKRTGLRDFGSDDFREPLDVLLRSYDEEAALTFVGRTAARMNTLRLLEQRLWFEEYRKRHPEIAAQEIRRPLVIVSLARAGTTILHRMLACDPANRTPLSWELMFPVPPPERATHDTDARIARAERELRAFERWLAPGLPAVHEVGARLPEECLMIMAYSFRSYQFPSMNWVPSYQRWMESHDILPGYAYHRRILQHLQWKCPGERWVLKAPAHIFGIHEIFTTYPDAGIVHMHRDPLEVVASLTSLTSAIYAAFSDDVDSHAVGREMVETLLTGLERYFAARDGVPGRNERFMDIDFRELAGDHIGTVRRIYERFDMELTDEAERRMRAFLAANRKGKHGEHRYSLAQFGIDQAVETRRFLAYKERFGV